MQIGVLAIPGTFDSALTSVLDVLATADSLRPSVDPQIAEIQTLTGGVSRTITTRRGLIVPIDPY